MADSRLLRCVAALAIAGAPSCGRAPTAPVATVTPAATVTALAESWVGAFDVATCTGRSCGTRTLPPERFALRLLGAGGVLVIGTPVSSTRVPMVIDVTSTSAGGTFVVTGQGPVPTGAGPPDSLEVRLELSALGDLMSGTVRYAVTTRDGVTTKQGPILYGGRELPVASSRFHGVWAGRVTRMSCTGDCAYDPFLGDGTVQMWIAQVGATATATYNTPLQTLTGTTDGTVINMSYRQDTPTCRATNDFDATCLVEFSISAGADALDRMTGTLTYHVEWVTYPSGRFSMTGTADLARVARWQ